MKNTATSGGDFVAPCVKCTGVNGAHSLRCPEINLTPGWYDRMLFKQEDQL